MSEWQPIETAPKHKRKIYDSIRAESVLLTDGASVVVGFWNGAYWDDGDFNSTMDGFTHWMPLPELPK